MAKATEKRGNYGPHVSMQCSCCGVRMSMLSCTHTDTPAGLWLKSIGRTVAEIEIWWRMIRGQDWRRQVQREFWTGCPAKRAQGVRVGDFWTRIYCKTSSYVAIVVYGQSFPAPRKKSAQIGLYTVSTLEQVVLKTDSFYSAATIRPSSPYDWLRVGCHAAADLRPAPGWVARWLKLRDRAYVSGSIPGMWLIFPFFPTLWAALENT